MEQKMTLAERVEKKIFFRITRFMIFLVVFLAFIATLVGVYTYIASNIKHKSDDIIVEKTEMDEIFRAKPKLSRNNANNTITIEESTEEKELKKLAEPIAKKILASFDITTKASNYNAKLGEGIDAILKSVEDYDHENKVSALTQLDELSKTFKKDKFVNQADAFFTLYKKKYDHEQELIAQKEAIGIANKTIAYALIGGGMVVFALFVMVLVMLRIEKNTRPIGLESDTYDATDKKLLIGIMTIGLIIAILIGFLLNSVYVNNDENYNPVAEVRELFINVEENATEANATADYDTHSDSDGATIYATCGACHGPDGKTAALGKSAIIAGQSVTDIETKLQGYKAGTRDITGNGAVMEGQVSNLSDYEIQQLAEYISNLSPSQNNYNSSSYKANPNATESNKIYMAAEMLGVDMESIITKQNSKGVTIYCTSDMSLCKTEREVAGNIGAE